MAMVRLNGIDLFVETTGAGSPVVLVHASWFDHADWELVVPLIAREHTVVTYDRRGHGQSADSSSPGTYGDDADDLLAVLSDVVRAPAHVVTHSSSGIIASIAAMRRQVAFASLNMHEPPLFDRLAGDPEAGPVLRPIQEGLASVREQLERGAFESAARDFSNDVAFGPYAWESELGADSRARMIANAPTFLDELRQPQRLSLDLTALATLRAPILLTVGGDSPRLRWMMQDDLRAAVPLAKGYVFAGARHAPHRTDPEMFARVVQAFATGRSMPDEHAASPDSGTLVTR
jgi:pimeloyl-ACP methyl ester carboxylesterase